MYAFSGKKSWHYTKKSYKLPNKRTRRTLTKELEGHLKKEKNLTKLDEK